MRKIFAVAALGLALTGFAVVPATAQSARDAVLTACGGASASNEACAIAMQAFLATTQGMTPRQKDAALADVVIALANTASTPAAQQVAATAIRSVTTEFTDQGRATAATQVAAAVQSNTVAGNTAVAALSASST